MGSPLHRYFGVSQHYTLRYQRAWVQPAVDYRIENAAIATRLSLLETAVRGRVHIFTNNPSLPPIPLLDSTETIFWYAYAHEQSTVTRYLATGPGPGSGQRPSAPRFSVRVRWDRYPTSSLNATRDGRALHDGHLKCDKVARGPTLVSFQLGL